MQSSRFLHLSDQNGILHLSDIHIGPYLRAREPILDKIYEEDLERIGVQYVAVVITGDLVEASLPEQYDEALRYFLRLRERIKVPPEHWVFVPGNHDVNLDLLKAHLPKNCFSVSKKDVEELPIERFDYFRGFLRKFYGDRYSEDEITSFINGGSTIKIHGPTAIIIGILNSCEHVTEKDSSGYVGSKQLSRLSANFSADDPNNSALRIVALHHSFLPSHHAVEHVINYEQLRRMIERLNIRIILHGHRHISSPDVVRRPWEHAELVILPTGSAGLEASVLGEGRNRYQVLSFDKTFQVLRIHMRMFEPIDSAPPLQGVWCPDVAYAENGVLEIPLRAAAHDSRAIPEKPSWDNAKLIASIRKTIQSIPLYVETYTTDSKGREIPIAPSLLYPRYLGQNKRIALIGECGIGKSTTLKFLARQCLRKKNRMKTHRIPIFFDLKLYSSDKSLWRNICENVSEELDSEDLDSVEFARSSGAMIFFLDSTDEVTDERVFDEIDGFVSLGNIVIAACRSSYFFLENMVSHLANFSKIEIKEWSDSQTYGLLRNLFPSTYEDSFIRSFAEEIPNWARSPLLIGLLYEAFLTGERAVFRQAKKSKLLQKVITHAAVYSRDNTTMSQIDVKIRKEIFSHVAWKMFETGKGYLKSKDLDDVVSQVRTTCLSLDERKRQMEMYVDSPIITWTADRMSFRHIAIQEYLVAERILEMMRSGSPLSFKSIPRDQTIVFLREMMETDDLPRFVDIAISNLCYWIVGLLSKFQSPVKRILASKLEHLFERYDDMPAACRLIWCTGELRLRSREIRKHLERIFEKCNEDQADIAWFTAFAYEKIWAIDQLPHYALKKLVTKYCHAEDYSLRSKLSCIVSVAKNYGIRESTFRISEEEICRTIADARLEDPRLYNAVWIAGALRIENAVNYIVDLLGSKSEGTGLSVQNCAIETLGKIGSRSSQEILLVMLRHRSLRLRWRALEALSINEWGRQQLKRLELKEVTRNIFSQLNLIGSPFERERIKKVERELGMEVV